MENSQLSSHDKDVLTRIFNPSLPYGDNVETDVPLEEIPEVETDEVKEAKRLEIEGVKAAESGNIDKALELLNQAVTIAPDHASSYNNRAQALRLHGDVSGALQDLNKAIELSGGHRKVACQAYTQRGIIKRLEGDDDGCKEDLRNAANLGGQFAKQLLVTMNPYAALCNQMLGEVIGKLRSGEGDLPME
ncbi:tetratricopeptide repeat protein 36 homolog [Ruditapes philippinarum]|uniref:tetratricopeptide repeat protein 36 homolog n=1 Tax=Ruditapes philippinarum TaxID=129788 RepID=UPI00295A7A7A|nr:tetratricopeptide repeat protein 36 homolog [Ruditapes philippinarum]